MRKVLAILFSVLCFGLSAQQLEVSNKGRFYFYWGWNKSAYSNSDIHFHAENFNFTLKDVVAKDRQTKDLTFYVNPGTVSIPQYNARIGYFITEKLSVSIGNDHMKYVVQPWQEKTIDGWINQSGTVYDGVYHNEEVILNPILIRFEHTDGLNYENLEVRYHDGITNRNKFYLDGFFGVGSGIALPKTNATILMRPRYDEFHVSGYAVHGLGGVTLSYLRKFFIQFEAKGGFMEMNDIRISHNSSEGAEQSFYFFQYNFVLGASLPIVKH